MGNNNGKDDEYSVLRDHPKIRKYKKSCIGTKQQSLEKIQKLTHLLDFRTEAELAMKTAVDEESFAIISYLISISNSNEPQSKIVRPVFERAFEQSKSLEFIKLLINLLGVKVDSYLISRSVEKAPFEIFKFFFQNFATEKEINDNLSDWVFSACKLNRFETFKYLIELNRFDIHSEMDSERNFTILQHACLYGFLEAVKYLIFEKGAQITVSLNGETLISIAGRGSRNYDRHVYLREIGNFEIENYELLVYLMEIGNFDVNQCDKFGRSPLWMACDEGLIKSVKYFIEKGAQVNQANDQGKTPLMIAINRTHFDIVKCLVQNGADVNLRCKRGWSPLICVVRHPSSDHDKNIFSGLILIENGADLLGCDQQELEWLNFNVFSVPTVPDIDLEQRNEEGLTMLMNASLHGNLKYAQNLVKRGANINARTERGDTALMYACRYNEMEIVKFLVENGVDIELPFNDPHPVSPVEFAFCSMHLDIVKYLVKVGANTSKLLPMVISFGNLEILKFLIENGVDFDLPDKHNTSPIEYAIIYKRLHIVKYLIDVGAKTTKCLDTVVRDGNLKILKYLVEKVQFNSEQFASAFYIAHQTNHSKIVKYLIEKRLVNFENLERNLTLEIAKLLVENGADIDEKNDLDFSPIEIAFLWDRFDIVKYLIGVGAKTTKILNVVVFKGNLEILKYLIERVQFDSKQFGSALYMASTKNHFEIVKYLIEKSTVDSQTMAMVFCSACENKQLEFVNYFIENQLVDFDKVGLIVALGDVQLETVKFLIEGKCINLKETIQAICKLNPTMENETTTYLNEKFRENRKKQMERKERKRKIKRKIQKNK